ncbi:uncharacterized protein B0P05DRAFT_592524 [Gilbertella persicaria]|uniref:uncharacterized protein n=1 Tax=Gilbertella persicaria TaxID=101096 RepID=UPI00221F9665|nr:uncharacterized protein B0P05DRAFT_592524 [Gilbertella persicaria]KAI8047732.1 hypothetical protein B0P05DRAFT_592524 [Gilbertella persicaria]
MINITSYKRRRLRQKPNILIAQQSRELGQLAGLRQLKNVTDQGIIPISLFRLRKRKLEEIYSYLSSHRLTHDKEPDIESLQTHELAEYLLHTIYPGYPACRAKNVAYADYRECREKQTGRLDPLAYDSVPTTEVYDRLDEVYRIDVDWQDQDNPTCSVDIPISVLKKSMERIHIARYHQEDQKEYHLCFWNSTRTLIKPQCTSLRLDSYEIWNDRQKKLVAEGFMHIDITESLIYCLSSKSSRFTLNHAFNLHGGTENSKPNSNRNIMTLQVELVDNNEHNISHISFSCVAKKSTEQLVCELYLQTMTGCIARGIRKSTSPLKAQQTAIDLLKEYHKAENIQDKLKNAEAAFMAYLDNNGYAAVETSSEEEYDQEDFVEIISLLDAVTKTRIKHPTTSIHCRHRTCFDAVPFFDQHAEIKLWHCPICSVHIKSFEELRVDYTVKVALNQYPDQDELYLFDLDRLSPLEAGAKRKITNSLSSKI